MDFYLSCKIKLPFPLNLKYYYLSSFSVCVYYYYIATFYFTT